MKKLLISLAAVLTITGCNSDGDGSGGGGSSDITLDSSSANSMAAYVDMGVSIKDSAYASAEAYISGKSLSDRNLGSCATETYTGNATSGSGTIVYDNCSFGDTSSGFTFDGNISISWSDTGSVQTFSIDGSFSMTITGDGQTVTISFDPMDITVEDNGTTISTSMDFKFNYSDGTTSGYLSMETVEDLVAPSSDPETLTSGKIKMNDGNGNIFYITYSGDSYTVTSS